MDCDPGTKRPAPFPGPRCATHHRAVKAKRKLAAQTARAARHYGVTDYDALYVAQGGTCAICQIATGKTKRLAIDHDHACCAETPTCGKCTRGLLCGPCNQMIGRAHDDPMWFVRAAQYLIEPPTKRKPLV